MIREAYHLYHELGVATRRRSTGRSATTRVVGGVGRPVPLDGPDRIRGLRIGHGRPLPELCNQKTVPEIMKKMIAEGIKARPIAEGLRVRPHGQSLGKADRFNTTSRPIIKHESRLRDAAAGG